MNPVAPVTSTRVAHVGGRGGRRRRREQSGQPLGLLLLEAADLAGKHPAGTLDDQHRDRVSASKPEVVNNLPDVGVDGDRASAGGSVRDPARHATVNEPPHRTVHG